MFMATKIGLRIFNICPGTSLCTSGSFGHSKYWVVFDHLDFSFWQPSRKHQTSKCCLQTKNVVFGVSWNAEVTSMRAACVTIVSHWWPVAITAVWLDRKVNKTPDSGRGRQFLPLSLSTARRAFQRKYVSKAAFTRIRIDPDIRMSQLRIGLPSTVRSGAEERRSWGARLDVLSFRLRSYHVLISYSAECNGPKFYKTLMFLVQAGMFLSFQARRSSATRSSTSDLTVHENDWSVRYPEQYATLSGAVRKRFQRWIIRMSRCSLETCKRGIRISGCHCACALRFPSTWKRFFFSSFRKLQKLSFAFSCPLNSTIWFKSFPHSFVNFEILFTCIDRTNSQQIHAKGVTHNAGVAAWEFAAW